MLTAESGKDTEVLSLALAVHQLPSFLEIRSGERESFGLKFRLGQQSRRSGLIRLPFLVEALRGALGQLRNSLLHPLKFGLLGTEFSGT